MHRRQHFVPGRQPVMIHWRGRAIPFQEAATLAAQEYQAGNFSAVSELYRLMLVKMPGSAELHNNLGAVLQLQEQFAEALVHQDKALALKPDYANAHFNRGITLKKLGRWNEALASYDKAISLKPDHVEAHKNRGVILQELRQYDQAMAAYKRASELSPVDVETINNQGTVLMSQGDMAGAEQMFRRAATLKPDFADALFNLASIRRHDDLNRSEIKKIRDLLGVAGLKLEDREQLLFSLGKILDDIGEFDGAFNCYREANEIRNRRVSFSHREVSSLTDELINSFSPDFFSSPAVFASESKTPIFIVGMPRSGTTLLAQILSGNPAVKAAGELPVIPEFAAQMQQMNPDGVRYPEALRYLSASSLRQMAEVYEQRLRRDFGVSPRMVIDKNPLNFQHLGFIARLFPGAKIFHCTRHPLDVCLSNYFQRFSLRLNFAFDLVNIARFYQEYHRLMQHWRQIPSVRMLEVRYEDMILDTGATARRALEFVGVDWDDRCLTPHLNRGSVETASHWQVRQPIYQNALGRWRNYEKHLGTIKEIFDEVPRIQYGL